VQNFHS